MGILEKQKQLREQKKKNHDNFSTCQWCGAKTIKCEKCKEIYCRRCGTCICDAIRISKEQIKRGQVSSWEEIQKILN